jgi:O-antigen/teichoic acid export membrane protein
MPQSAPLDDLEKPASPPSPPKKEGNPIFGAASVTLQALILNLISIPTTAYIIFILGPSAYGQWNLSLTLTLATTFFTNLGLRGTFVRAIAQDPESAPQRLAEQLGLRLLLSLFAGVVSIAACVGLGYPLVTFKCTLIAVVGLVILTIKGSAEDLFQAFQSLPRVAYINFIAGLSLTLASLVVAMMGLGPIGISFAYLVGPAVSAFFLLRYIHRNFFPIRIRWNFSRFWTLLKESRFMAIQQGVASVGIRIDGILVSKIIGVAPFGLFSAGTLIDSRLELVPEGLNMAFYTAISQNYRRDLQAATQEAARLLRLMVSICLPLAALVSFSAGPIADILFSKQYAVSQTIICITAWSLPLMGIASALGYALNAAGKEYNQMRAAMAASLSSWLVSFFLVSRFGLIGACWSLSARYVFYTFFFLPYFIQAFPQAISSLPVKRLAAYGGLIVLEAWQINSLVNALVPSSALASLHLSGRIGLFAVLLLKTGLEVVAFLATAMALKMMDWKDVRNQAVKARNKFLRKS